MSTYTTAAVPVHRDPKSQVDQLVARMTAALDEIAVAAGAQHCPYCGKWTLELIDLTGVDEFGRIESEIFCRRCAPLSF